MIDHHRQDRYSALTRQLKYHFVQPELLEQALAHRSAGTPHNERLEFLGDAMLNIVIADELFRRFPHANEGDLTRMRAALVRGSTLAKLAVTLQLGDYLRLGPGELKSGGFRRDSILAGAFEAMIGAVYLDGGFDVTRALLMMIYEDLLAGVSPQTQAKDPKTQLQEFLQARHLPLPEYRVVSTEGKAHAQIFHVECCIPTVVAPLLGQGNSRRAAEQEAAQATLAALTAQEQGVS